METKIILEKIAEIFNTDATFISATNSPKIFVGYNLQTPPKKDDMPAVILDSVKKRSVIGFIGSCEIILGFLNYSEQIETIGKITTYKGFIDSEILREEATKALLRNQNKLKAKISFSEGETYTNLVFPIFSAKINVKLEYNIPANRLIDSI